MAVVWGKKDDVSRKHPNKIHMKDVRYSEE